MPSLNSAVQVILKKSRREKNGFIYTIPSPDTYPYQWFWDSCFHAIVLSHFDITWAKNELLSLVSQQFENGLIPHMIYWEKAKSFGAHKANPKWGVKKTSSITQPPIIADAVLKIFQKDQDKYFLEKIYPSLKKFYFYLINERDLRFNHLISIINPDESGEDNSPRFDALLGLPSKHDREENFQKRLELVKQNLTCSFDARKCMHNFFWAKDVPFNVFMVKNLQSLAKIAKALGNIDDEKIFIHQANLIKKAMRDSMFEDGIFWSLFASVDKDEMTYQKIKVKTWAIFAPLFAKLYTKDEAEELVDEHLLNKKEFWPTFPVPTVSLDEPSFDPGGFWRGPTWISTNWFIFQGLLNYQFFDLAKEIYKKSKYLIGTEGFREYFNPQTGKGLGAKDFTWGSLVLDMENTLKQIK